MLDINSRYRDSSSRPNVSESFEITNWTTGARSFLTAWAGAEAWSKDLDPKTLIQRPWSKDLDPKTLIQRSWSKDLDPKILIQRSWSKDLDPKILIQRSWSKDLAPRHHAIPRTTYSIHHTVYSSQIRRPYNWDISLLPLLLLLLAASVKVCRWYVAVVPHTPPSSDTIVRQLCGSKSVGLCVAWSPRVSHVSRWTAVPLILYHWGTGGEYIVVHCTLFVHCRVLGDKKS